VIFSLAQDFHDAVAAIPPGHPKHRMLELLEEAIRRDIHFIARHPTTLFQCMWNTCWWYDCPEAEKHYELGESLNMESSLLSDWMTAWCTYRELERPGFQWIRSLRPPALSLGSSLDTMLKGHSNSVLAISVSPDGVKVATGSEDTSIIVWYVNTGMVCSIICGHKDGVSGLAWIGGSRRLASVSWDGSLRVWNEADGSELMRVSWPGHKVTSLAISPDGSIAACGASDMLIHLVDTSSGHEVQTLRGNQSAVNTVAFSPDGSLIAGGDSSGCICLWNANTGEAKGCLEGHKASVESVSFSPKEYRLASCSRDKTLRVWDCLLMKELLCPQKIHNANSVTRFLSLSVDSDHLSIEWHHDELYSVCFSPDGSLIASGGRDAAIQVWDARTGSQISWFHGHEDYVNAVAFVPDGTRIISGACDRTARVWKNVGEKRSDPILKASGSLRLSHIDVSPDGTTLAVGWADGRARLCSTRTGHMSDLPHRHRDFVVRVAFAPDGTLLASVGADGSLYILDSQTLEVKKSMKAHRSAIHDVVFSPDGVYLATAGIDKRLNIWCVETGLLYRSIQTTASIWCLAYSPDGSLLFFGQENGQVNIYCPGKDSVGDLRDQRGPGITCVACSATAFRVAAGCEDGLILIWDIDKSMEPNRLSGHGSIVRDIAFSPDGGKLVSNTGVIHIGGSGETRIWDAISGECLEIWKGWVDVDSLAKEFSLFGCVYGDGTALETVNKKQIGWYPQQLDEIRGITLELTWVGGVGNYLAILKLEKG